MTSVETSFTPLLVTGFAELLAAQVPEFTWSLNGDYEPTDTGIGVLRFPLMCDRAVAISPYQLSAHPTLSTSRQGIQFRSRSGSQDPFDAMAMDDLIQHTFLGLFPLLLPTGLHVSSLMWTSGASLGFDESDRPGWSSNFAAEVTRPHRTP